MRRQIVRFLRCAEAIAAVEFGLISPVLITAVMLMMDFGYGYFLQLRVIQATSAAAQYAYLNGQSLSATTVTSFISNVQAVAVSTAGLPAAPTVTVLVNDAPGSANVNNYYCVSGTPIAWTSTGTSSSSCGSNVLSGKYISITVSATSSTIFHPDPVLGSVMTLTDYAIVRVQ